MDPAALERAREKAEAVRASLQQKQQSIVDRRRQQEQKSEPSAAPAPAPTSTDATATTILPIASRAADPASKNASVEPPQVQRESAEASGAAERRSGQPSRAIPSPPVMEDFTASANDDDDSSSSSDDEDDTGSTFHDDEERSTTQETGADSAAATAAATAAPNEVPHTKEVRFSLSNVSTAADEPTNDASAETTIIPPFQPRQQPAARASGTLQSASVTRQVLSSPDSDPDTVQPREPRYLRYRDSLRTSLQKSTTSSTNSASAARDSLASSDDNTPIKNQLLSYFDKSLPPPIGSASGTADDAASEPM